ncbi:MAG: glycoside hydrolase family 92 protein, partial [Propionicimonas sp.]|nr:glycoside hydrolase family 92 protein [Propionicimonas sp.]
MTTLSITRQASPFRLSLLQRVAIPTALALLASGLAVPLATPAHAAGDEPATDYTQFVDPFVATEDDFGQDGPGAFVPHGIAKITPLSNPRSHTGYDYNSTAIKGFTAITLDGVGGNGAGGDFLVSPTYQTYTARPATSSYDKTYSHANESASPGYYQVGLTESGKTINAQATVDTRTGVQDFTFGSAGKASLVVDLANNFGTRQGGSLTVGTTSDGRTSLSGSLKGYFYNSSYSLHYYAETTVPVSTVSTWGSAGLSTSKLTQSGTDIGAILSFNVAAGARVGLNVTLSPISPEQARRDMQAEIGGKSFDDVRAAATAEWNDTLGVVEVEEGVDDDPTGDLKEMFYTHLFRMSGSPINATSTDGTYRGVDGKIYQAEGYTHYDSWSLWDDFHKYSSIAAVYPGVYRDVAQSLVDLFVEMGNSGASGLGGLLHSVPTVRWERAAVVVADAINKGADLKGLEQAYP